MEIRKSGILMPIFSLPSEFGIGDLGKEAYNFVDFLRSAGQHYWQVLPIGPTGFGDSPYQCFSAFAGNPYFISLEILFEEGLINKKELDEARVENIQGTIDYQNLYSRRYPLLKKATKRIADGEVLKEFRKFKEKNSFWLDDYALFMAIKEDFLGKSHSMWPKPLRDRNDENIQRARDRLHDSIECHCKLQYIFFKQWNNLKAYAEDKNVFFIGDIPIYVAPDSVDVWANPKLFIPQDKLVAGCPPDDFSEDGQLWGNPLYDWKYHKETKYQWWINRINLNKELFQIIRIDHFRGFAGFYAIPYNHKDAKNGKWLIGPGKEFIDVIKSDGRIIAEDLGFITDDVYELLRYSNFPGMKVLQFAFTLGNFYLPHNHCRNSVVYTGTHDNDTLLGWIRKSNAEVDFAVEYLGIDNRRFEKHHNKIRVKRGKKLATNSQIIIRDSINKFYAKNKEYQRSSNADRVFYRQVRYDGKEQLKELVLAEAMIRSAMSSVSNTAIIPLQDWLLIGSEGRINSPNTIGDNWKWRCKKEHLTEGLSNKIRLFTEIYGRV